MEILSNANIEEVGRNYFTTSDAAGRFSIDVKDQNAQLKISHVGYDYDTFPVDSGEIKDLGYVTLFSSQLDGATVENKFKKSNTLLYFFGGLIVAVAGYKIFGKPQPKKVKV